MGGDGDRWLLFWLENFRPTVGSEKMRGFRM